MLTLLILFSLILFYRIANKLLFIVVLMLDANGKLPLLTLVLPFYSFSHALVLTDLYCRTSVFVFYSM